MYTVFFNQTTKCSWLQIGNQGSTSVSSTKIQLVNAALSMVSHYNVLQSELRTKGIAMVTFRFLKHPEVIFKDSKLLIRQDTTGGMCTVTSVTPYVSNESTCHNVTAVNSESAFCNVTAN